MLGDGPEGQSLPAGLVTCKSQAAQPNPQFHLFHHNLPLGFKPSWLVAVVQNQTHLVINVVLQAMHWSWTLFS
jgi:hypothetical protein